MVSPGEIPPLLSLGWGLECCDNKERERLEEKKDSLPSIGVQTHVSATIFSGIVAGGLDVQFFPSTCEIGAYSYMLGVYEGGPSMGAIPPDPALVFGSSNLDVLKTMSWGVSGALGVEPMFAVPVGPGLHDAASWRGYSFGLDAGPISVWGNSAWSGLSFVVGPGAGVSWSVAYYQWMTEPIPSVWSVEDTPVIGECLCMRLRRAAELTKLDEIKAFFDAFAEAVF